MDEAANGVKKEPSSPENEAARIEEHVEATREHLDSVIGELDRRRHRAAVPALVAGGLAAAAVGLALWARRRQRRRAQASLARWLKGRWAALHTPS